MDSLFDGLAVPLNCPHCGYVIEHPVGEPIRHTHCPRCCRTLDLETAAKENKEKR
jgi:endogenous inhibitor of DNA gyrase (YacG/DUF329 family)